jgi:hypothetical protein
VTVAASVNAAHRDQGPATRAAWQYRDRRPRVIILGWILDDP